MDIHSHLLAGIDDGAKNWEESIALIKRMKGLGIHNFIVTPHVMEGVWENTPKRITGKLKELEKQLQAAGIKGIKLRAAAEYMLDSNFSKLIKAKDLLCLKDKKILVEMSYINPPINLYELLFDLQIAGYQPVLAHPERYSFYHRNFKEYYKLREAGCLFQLNLLSLSSYYGKEIQKTAKKLLKENLIDYVGTDTHHQLHLSALESINTQANYKLIASALMNNEKFL